ncbi:DUF4179 domain-containing protein [Paenibacillus polymyxa]|uniref:DUF4179 domain-containing protein n=1 Tax=Paenibacillus polymyxa TaxID=1406 RepID=UPI000304FA63|nr:DUF4179 domain-containing protein [Paenibacillus polymyxa]MDU8674750.1 DUF4179 domain-containing protein [Paenibacillus polymyxa]MDU8699657.1 DUF4179 domain-containing protein [Paenibacillus polymyxa]NMP09195.1 DUF4179 domain-containing protein [Paenibacillus polymyxa]URJ68813.1 DUF4179 domain-containing protein [Paenibacillus polymyxa]WDZ57876.1 DUF4179 domain-containing protein [Paenibacillus polymyxa]
MDKHLTPPYEREMDPLENWIHESVMPRGSMSDQIMKEIEKRAIQRKTTKPKFAKRAVLAASVVGILGAGVVGAGFVSPTMAATLKQIPGIGSIFYGLSSDEIQTAVDKGILSHPNESVTHDGITLTLSDVLYDGTRLSFSIERQGENMPEGSISPYVPMDAESSGNNEWLKAHQVPEKDQLKGYFKHPEVQINGKKVDSQQFIYGDDPHKKNSVVGEFMQLGSLPDEFVLTVKTSMTGINEPYEFKVPVKIDNTMIVVQPNETKTSNNFSYTVKELKATSTTTRLVLDSTGEVPASQEQTGEYAPTMMYYDIADDQGNILEQRKFGYFHSKPKTKYHVDELYDALKPNTKYVTIKPFTLTVKPTDWSIVGQVNDKVGNEVKKGDKTYIKELEMKISVPAQ